MFIAQKFWHQSRVPSIATSPSSVHCNATWICFNQMLEAERAIQNNIYNFWTQFVIVTYKVFYDILFQVCKSPRLFHSFADSCLATSGGHFNLKSADAMWRKNCLEQTLKESFAHCINVIMITLTSIKYFQFMPACDPSVEGLPKLIYFNSTLGPSEKHF